MKRYLVMCVVLGLVLSADLLGRCSNADHAKARRNKKSYVCPVQSQARYPKQFVNDTCKYCGCPSSTHTDHSKKAVKVPRRRTQPPAVGVPQ